MRRAEAIGEDVVTPFRPSDYRPKKKNETKFVVALGGCQSMITHNNQPDYRMRDGGGIGEDARLSGNEGGGRIRSFWGRSSWEDGEYSIK